MGCWTSYTMENYIATESNIINTLIIDLMEEKNYQLSQKNLVYEFYEYQLKILIIIKIVKIIFF